MGFLLLIGIVIVAVIYRSTISEFSKTLEIKCDTMAKIASAERAKEICKQKRKLREYKSKK